MLQPPSGKKSWFGPKRVGFGIAPQTWQGWLVIVLGVIAEIGTVRFAHATWPQWYVAKTHGSGFNPVTWQGYVILFLPAALCLLLIWYIYSSQKNWN